MSAPSNLIDGNAIAATLHKEIAEQVASIVAQSGGAIVPCLSVILVGGRTDSATYVRMKKRAAEKLGLRFHLAEFPESASEDEVVAAVEAFNNDASVHGIIVQLPLPAHMNEKRVIDSVALAKDVDGFHPDHMGRVARREQALFLPCTAAGCIELLQRSNVQISGKHAVVLGRSKLVGLPVSLLLLNLDATVTICHSKTKDLPSVVAQADILIVAIGRPEFVRGSWVKDGAVVIDVGINGVPDATRKSGQRLVGDVAFDEVAPKASLITPVPGGVGPMTVSILLKNTLTAAQRLLPAA